MGFTRPTQPRGDLASVFAVVLKGEAAILPGLLLVTSRQVRVNRAKPVRLILLEMVPKKTGAGSLRQEIR